MTVRFWFVDKYCFRVAVEVPLDGMLPPESFTLKRDREVRFHRLLVSGGINQHLAIYYEEGMDMNAAMKTVVMP